MTDDLNKSDLPLSSRLYKVYGSLFERFRLAGKSWIEDRRALREAHTAFSNPDSLPVLIYQMGKVGSTSLYHSLKTAMPSDNVLHVHILSDEIEDYIQMCRQSGSLTVFYHFRVSLAVRSILKADSARRCRIISLVRDPIAVAISTVFQLPQFVKNSCLNNDGTYNCEKVIAHLDERLSDMKTFDYIFTWFDRELNKVFDIDVFSKVFDKKNGYSIYNGPHSDALVLRLEDLNTKGPDVVAKFLGLQSPLILHNKNVRKKSRTGFVYEDVLKKLVIPRALCEQIYCSRFARQFYTQKEIEDFTAKWSKSKIDL